MTPQSDETRPRTEAEPLLPCPRCPVRLRRHDLVKHLWLQHRLLLDGQRAREPWAVVEDWVRAYRASGDRALLARGFDLATHIDAAQAAERLRGLLADGGPQGPDPFAEASQQRASLCPHCLAFVPIPVEPPIEPLPVTRGRLSQGGYLVEISERSLVPALRVATPRGIVFQGPEGSERWTRRAALAFFVWPPVLLALVLALVLHLLEVRLVWPVVLALAVAVLAYLYIRVRGLLTDDLDDRVVNHAWTRLVPALLAEGVSTEDSTFLSALALASVGRGNPAVRERIVDQAMNATEKAFQSGRATLQHVAVLCRLAATDAWSLGLDPVPLLARQLSRCLEGVLPLAFAEQLVDGWGGGSPAARARLRVLVCERAFDAGFLVGDLVRVGQLAPALGKVLETERPDALARLRFLWAIRADKPWTTCGNGFTIFELAAHAVLGAVHLESYPGLLLLADDASAGGDTDARIRLCADGVVIQKTLISETPRTIEVKALKPSGGANYQLLVDEHVFWFAEDPDRFSRRLERWCHYFFADFVPQADAQDLQRTSPAAARLRARDEKICPKCGRPSLPRRGDLGIPL